MCAHLLEIMSKRWRSCAALEADGKNYCRVARWLRWRYFKWADERMLVKHNEVVKGHIRQFQSSHMKQKWARQTSSRRNSCHQRNRLTRDCFHFWLKRVRLEKWRESVKEAVAGTFKQIWLRFLTRGQLSKDQDEKHNTVINRCRNKTMISPKKMNESTLKPGIGSKSTCGYISRQ